MEAHELEQDTTLDQEQADFINSLEGDFAPANDSELNSGGDEMALQAATMTGLTVINTAETMLRQFGHEKFKWEEDHKQATAAAMAPALVKNGGQLPEWLEPYKEELIAIMAIGSLSFGGYMQVKQLKAIDAKQEAEKKPESEGMDFATA